MPPCRFGLLQSNLGSKRWKTRVDLMEFLDSARLILDCTPLHRINLDVLCAEIGISKHHFVRLFHEAFGQPPLAYATARALNRASICLVQTRKPVSQIAEEIGFCDSSSFGRAFQRAFGQTPTAYRVSSATSTSPIEPASKF